VRAATAFDDESLDYALVDSAPRGCLGLALVPKIRSGGCLILDNADWYWPPPPEVRPRTPAEVRVAFGSPGSTAPTNRCWPALASATGHWARVWSSDGVQMTLILIKP
jgi:hypothetical protein